MLTARRIMVTATLSGLFAAVTVVALMATFHIGFNRPATTMTLPPGAIAAQPAPARSATVAKAYTAPARPWITKTTDPGDDLTTMSCAGHLQPLEVAVGSHGEAGGAVTYSLLPDPADVTVLILKATGQTAAIVTAIVHTTGPVEGTGSDVELPLNLPPGGQVNHRLASHDYVYGQASIYNIRAVTLCIQR